MRRNVFKNKKGEGDEILYPLIIRIIAYIVFFSVISIFVYKSASGALVYEQSYAKDIALLLDKSKSGTTITYDISKGIEIGQKNGKLGQNIIDINSQEGYVDVRLSTRGGYRYYFFSNYNIEKIINEETKTLTLIVREK